jgi:hypothetical protein
MNEYSNKNKYFAADEPDKAVNYLTQKSGVYFNAYLRNNYLDKIRKSWESYHGAYYDNGHEVSFGGEQGEMVNLPVNHYRNIATNILNLVCANRPAFMPRSTNLDARSESQVMLASGLLDYYMREKKMERYLKKAVEYAVVLGAGYIKMTWNATSGKIYDYMDPTEPFDKEGNEVVPYPIYEGDVQFSNLSPYDVVFDTSKESYEDNEWVLVRSFKNKYALAEKYPELKDKILELETKSEKMSRRVHLQPYDETCDVPIYEFFHKKNEALPNGRYLIYLSDDIILMDNPLPYREIPIYRITASDYLGTPFGYTPMFDLLPIQSAVNSLYSTILTNQNAFGVQNILNPRGNDIRVTQVEGGMNFLDYNAQFGKPEPLNLTHTPQEIFNFLQMLEKSMEVISGMNPIVRGNIPTEKFSGNAMALIQSQAIQFISGLQQSYIEMIEDTGTGLINLLRDFAAVPRIAAIVGIDNQTKITEFTGEDLDMINRVLVDVGNPLAATTAGKVAMAEQLLQMGAIDSPEKYIEVINTGKLRALTSNNENQLLLIRTENEHMLRGDIEVLAIHTDKHSLHIREHSAVLGDPKLRYTDPELIQRVDAHLQQHYDILRNTPPEILALIGEQSLMAPQMPPDASMGQMPEQLANPQAAGVAGPPQQMQLPGESPKKTLPSPAKPALPPGA